MISQTGRDPLFSRRRFEDNVIIRCIRWYLRFKLSYREMAEIARKMGISVAPCTILRWVVRYSEEIAKRWLHFEQRLCCYINTQAARTLLQIASSVRPNPRGTRY